MSSRSKFVQINRSLIVLDPNTMPVNLGHATREDYPEQAFPALAYDGKNILPTALGYTSYFGENTRLNIGDGLKEVKVQHIFQYQAVNMRTLSIALCETGIYIANSSEGPNSFNWQLVVDLSADFVEGVRRLWTFCVISNRLYMYQQGNGFFYALVNGAEYQEIEIPSAITGATIEQAWYHEVSQTGLLRYKPNFINMEGQVGIFKGGNRLGFWDSDGAVAWSSATQIYDFTPSATTFAGITKFTDVVGRITLILQHGTGFIIYATRSIVLVSPITGSPEKWSGRAIFSDVGVVFDSQVALGQPDSVHYAITSAGLCRISGGVPEILETEVMDYIRNNNEIYAISFVDSRYIFIHATNTFDSALPEIDVEVLKDSKGNKFVFPKPVQPETNYEDVVLGIVNGTSPSQQLEFSEAQEPDAGMILPKDNEALLPCWELKTVRTNLTESAIPGSVLTRVDPMPDMPSFGFPGSKYDWNTKSSAKLQYVGKAELDAYYYDLVRTGIDLGPTEFLEAMNEELPKILELQSISERAANRIGSGVNSPSAGNWLGVVAPSSSALETRWTEGKFVLFKETLNNVIDEFSSKVTDCGIQILAQKTDVEISGTVTGMRESVRDFGFESMTVAIVYGAASKPGGLDTKYGSSAVAISLDAYPIDTQSAKILAAKASKRAPEGLNWESRIGQNVSDIRSKCSLGAQPAEPIPVAHIVNDVWVESTTVGGPGLDGAKVASVLGWSVPTIQEAINGGEGGSGSPECRNTFEQGNRTLFASLSSPPNNAIAGGTAFYSVNTREATLDSWDVCSEPSWLSSVTGERVYAGSHGYHSVQVSAFPLSDPEQIATKVMQAFALQGTLPEFLLVEARAKVLEVMRTKRRMRTLEGYGFSIERTKDFSRFPDPIPLLEAEVSGYGYYPYGGFSFRKTHSRSIFKPCGYSNYPVIVGPPREIDPGEVKITLPGAGAGDGAGKPKPPYIWDYPETIPLDPNYVLFQEGTFAPYYPTYEEAVVLDTQLNKWGRYNTPHKYVYNLLPMNRTDQTIVPTEAGTMRAGALGLEGYCSIFTSENPASKITYGKIGDYRLGWTKATKTVAQFAYASNCYIVVETSLDGEAIDESLSQAVTVEGTRRIEMPFTLAGKWFNIRFEGTFDLVGLSLESEAKSRR